MPNLKLKVANTCPVVVSDISDYSDVVLTGKITLGDLSALTANETSVVDSITIDGVEVLLTPFSVFSDSTGAVVYPRCLWTNILASLDADIGFTYTLFDICFNATGNLLTSQCPEQMSTATNVLVARNISVFDADGKQVLINGQQKQVSKIELLLDNYTAGDVFTISSCDNTTFDYTVQAGFTSKKCVCANIAKGITDTWCYVEASCDDDHNIIISSIEAGVPHHFGTGFSEPDPETYISAMMVTTANISSVPVIPAPNEASDGSIIYSPESCGGQYTYKLTTVTTESTLVLIDNDCLQNYDFFEIKAYNYCKDIEAINCAIAHAIVDGNQSKCSCNGSISKNINDARTLLEAINYMMAANYKMSEIGSLVEMAKSRLNIDDCNCNG
jgi:hypothetical protein